MKPASDTVLKLLGVLLFAAAVLKGWQLLTEPVSNNDIWSYRPFLILQVCVLGRLAESKEWFVTTPAVALLSDGQVKSAWEGKAPDLHTILAESPPSNVHKCLARLCGNKLFDSTKPHSKPLRKEVMPGKGSRRLI
jgi:hypothetical protein